jgi:hypothetical protein
MTFPGDLTLIPHAELTPNSTIDIGGTLKITVVLRDPCGGYTKLVADPHPLHLR